MNQFRKTAISLATAHAALPTTGLALAQAAKQYMQQGIGVMQRPAFHTGRRYTVQMRYSF
jgi:hypothetical protein